MSMRKVRGVYLADTARVLGNVALADNVSVWYAAVIRGDVAPITIGPGTNVQDNAMIHCDSGVPTMIGSRVTIGHNAVVHGKSVGDGTLIGMHATVLGQTVIGKSCLIAAGTLVPPGLEVPDGMVVMGVPSRIVRETNDQEKQYLAWLWDHYAKLAKLHHQCPNHPRVKPWDGNQRNADVPHDHRLYGEEAD